MTYSMKNFITSKIEADIKHGVYETLAFRFPPEPNGFLHLGHAKSIILNSFLAKKYGGKLYLRLDDTNPETENTNYVDNIINDSRWLTLKEFDAITYTSDYFDNIYKAACHLIKNGLAYVDFSTEEELKNSRGGFTSSDKETIYRSNSAADNLSYFEDMKNGKYKDGEAVLRAKIDLSHKNMNMRDPIMYRIKHSHHHRTDNKWCIYPMYDFAHPLSDAIEKISHSLCTLEFEDHRVLYNWYVDNCFDIFNFKPVEIEFARLDVENISLSKRKLLSIVNEHDIEWTSCVMPTISGMRNKGITPEIITDYILKCGFSKVNSLIPEYTFLECVRTALKKCDKIYAVLDAVELCFDKTPEGFHDKVFIDANDVREKAEDDFWRVYPDNWVRLKHGYNFKAIEIDFNAKVVKATIDFNSHDLKSCDIKPKTAIHWLAEHKKIKARFYEPVIVNDEYNLKCLTEKEILIFEDYKTNCHYEFERIGYFYIDENHVAHHLAWLNKNDFTK